MDAARRLIEVDGGPGDRHQLLQTASGWWGAENLFTYLPRYARRHATDLLLQAALSGAAQYDRYTITELPLPSSAHQHND